MARLSRLVPAATLALGVFAAAGCQGGKQAPPPPPVPKVTVSRPVVRNLVDYGEYTGYTEAVQRVEIRPRVKGQLEKVHVPEGTEIEQGTLLYEIDPREYQVARDEAKAALDRAVADKRRSVAEVERSQASLNRAARLRGTGGVSQEEYEQAVASEKTAAAAVGQADAAIQQAKEKLAGTELQLGYTRIEAPISGRVSRTQVTEKNQVNEETVLTVMVDQDPIYVYFDIPERDATAYQERAKARGLPLWSDAKIPVEVGVAGETGYPHQGVINFRDPRFEPGSGTLRIRGVLDNSGRKLSSGMFARVRFPTGEPRDRLMVPAAAVLSDQRGRYVLVVGPDNTAEYRAVTLGPRVGELVAVEKGITADDWVVVAGVQKARPKSPIDPERKPLAVEP